MISSDKKYEGTAIDKVTDSILLSAIKNLCAQSLSIKWHVTVFDDGEWDHKLNKVLNLFESDIDELSKIKPDETNKYSGYLTVEKLLSEFYDFYAIVSCTSPLGDYEAQFVIAYEFLENKMKDEKAKFLTTKKRSYFWDDIHKDIKKLCYARYSDGHYVDAVEAAFKEVIKRVKDYVNSKINGNLDGDKAMNRAFGFENQEPLIKFNEVQSTEEKDEQRGIMHLFKGIVGIRNRKAHENIVIDDPNHALEYLALASLLMRLLDKYAKKLANKKTQRSL